MNKEADRLNAKKWYDSIIRSSRYGNYAYLLKQRGFTYVQIRDYFAGKGFK